MHYSIDVSTDGKYLGVGVAVGNSTDGSGLFLIYDSEPVYFTGFSGREPQWVSQVEFVSAEFGFLLARSIDPVECERQNWPIVPASLERFGLDGTRKVIAASLPSPLTSLSVSPDHRLVAVCNQMSADFETPATCRIFSLEDGSMLSMYSPPYVRLLKAEFVGDSQQCLIVAAPPHWPGPGRPVAQLKDKGIRAFLMDVRDGSVMQEYEIRDDNRSTDVYDLRSSPQTNEAFVAVHGEIGRFTLKAGRFEYERFYSVGAFDSGFVPQWIDYNAKTGRLAVGESYGGSHEQNAVRIIDTKTRRAFDARINNAGIVRFSPDGEALYVLSAGVHKYYLNQMR